MFRNKRIIAVFLLIWSHYTHTFVLLTASVQDVRKFVRKFMSEPMMQNVISFVSAMASEDNDQQIEILFNPDGAKGFEAIKKRKLRLQTMTTEVQQITTDQSTTASATTASYGKRKEAHKRLKHRLLLAETQLNSGWLHSTRQIYDRDIDYEINTEKTRNVKLHGSKNLWQATNNSVVDDLKRVIDESKKKNEDEEDTIDGKNYKSDIEPRNVPPIFDAEPHILKNYQPQFQHQTEKERELTTRRQHEPEKENADVISIEIADETTPDIKTTESFKKKRFSLEHPKRGVKRAKHNKYYRMFNTDTVTSSDDGTAEQSTTELSTPPYFDITPYSNGEFDVGSNERRSSYNTTPPPHNRKKPAFKIQTTLEIKPLTYDAETEPFEVETPPSEVEITNFQTKPPKIKEKPSTAKEERTPYPEMEIWKSTYETDEDKDKQFLLNKGLHYNDAQARAVQLVSTTKTLPYSQKRYNGFNIDVIRVKQVETRKDLNKSRSIRQLSSGSREVLDVAGQVPKRSEETWWISNVPKPRADTQVAVVNIKQIVKRNYDVHASETARENLTVPSTMNTRI